MATYKSTVQATNNDTLYVGNFLNNDGQSMTENIGGSSESDVSSKILDTFYKNAIFKSGDTILIDSESISKP